MCVQAYVLEAEKRAGYCWVLRLPAGGARKSSIAQPFGRAQEEEHGTEGEAHEGDQQREPAGVSVRALGSDAAKNGGCKQCGEEAND